MKPEEKDLLLKELCARLPYGIKCHEDDVEYSFDIIGTTTNNEEFVFSDGYERSLEQIKPYLRPMSSMTEEEKKKLKEDTCPKGTGYFDDKYLICPINHYGEHISYEFMSAILEWLNAHHFDYRGLIEKGLALEAPEGMYNVK